MGHEPLCMIAVNLKLLLEEAYYVSCAKQMKNQEQDTVAKFIKSGTSSNILFMNILFYKSDIYVCVCIHIYIYVYTLLIKISSHLKSKKEKAKHQ